MTLYDSSALIDYLDGVDTVVEYVLAHAGERAVAPPLVLFEIYQGELHRADAADFDAVDAALEWLTVIDASERFARDAVELQAQLQDRGTPLAARHAFVAGTAIGLSEPLVVSDPDFDVAGLHDAIDLTILDG